MATAKYLQSALALAALLNGTGGQATEVTLKPATKWIADYQDEDCSIRRGFIAEGRKAMVLELSSFSYGENFRVKVYGEGITVRDNPPRTKFEPDDTLDQHKDAVLVKFTDGKRGILYKDMIFRNSEVEKIGDKATESWRMGSAARDARENEITALFIGKAFQEDVRLQTGSLHGALEALRTCLADLAKTDGLDPEKLEHLSRQVTAKDILLWTSKVQEVYPDDMARKGRSASVDVRLIVDEQGKPATCLARNLGQEESFTSTACERMMRYARFEPALDADGHPTRGYYTTTINYWLL